MQIEWSEFALNDREAIFDYILQDSSNAAVAVDDRIERQVENLAQFPEMGRPGRIEQTRELVIQRTPYIVAYYIHNEVVLILRVLHGARQWPEDLNELLDK